MQYKTLNGIIAATAATLPSKSNIESVFLLVWFLPGTWNSCCQWAMEIDVSAEEMDKAESMLWRVCPATSIMLMEAAANTLKHFIVLGWKTAVAKMHVCRISLQSHEQGCTLLLSFCKIWLLKLGFKNGFCILQYLCLCMILKNITPGWAKSIHNYRRREGREHDLALQGPGCFLWANAAKVN